MLALGFGTSVTVGECLGDPPENWYRAASGAPADAAVSQSLVCKKKFVAFFGGWDDGVSC